MATPTWQNVGGVNFGASNALLANASDKVSTGLNSLGNTVKDVGQGILTERESPLTQELAKLQAVGDFEGMQAVVDSDTGGLLQDPASHLRDIAQMQKTETANNQQRKIDYMANRSAENQLVKETTAISMADVNPVFQARETQLTDQKKIFEQENPLLKQMLEPSGQSAMETVRNTVFETTTDEGSREDIMKSVTEEMAKWSLKDKDGNPLTIAETSEYVIRSAMLESGPTQGFFNNWITDGKYDPDDLAKLFDSFNKFQNISNKTLSENTDKAEQLTRINRDLAKNRVAHADTVTKENIKSRKLLEQSLRDTEKRSGK
jgi:hypothetical protein